MACENTTFFPCFNTFFVAKHNISFVTEHVLRKRLLFLVGLKLNLCKVNWCESLTLYHGVIESFCS